MPRSMPMWMTRAPRKPRESFDRPITLNMAVAFLSGTHRRLGEQCAWQELSADLLQAIFFGFDRNAGLSDAAASDEPFTWEQHVLRAANKTPLSFAVIQPYRVSPNKNLFGSRSISVDWLKVVFDYAHWPTPTVPWSLCLDFGHPQCTTASPALHRDWTNTVLHAGCTADSCTCTMPFAASARATCVLGSMTLVNRKQSTPTLRAMQRIQDNYHQLFECTRRFRATWFSVYDKNCNFMLSEPTWFDLRVANDACKERMHLWVMQCLHQIWGQHNCDMFVRVRRQAEGLQIFVFGRSIMPEQVLQSHLFASFRTTLNGRQYL